MHKQLQWALLLWPRDHGGRGGEKESAAVNAHWVEYGINSSVTRYKG
jgi:hypothetical protein